MAEVSGKLVEGVSADQAVFGILLAIVEKCNRGELLTFCCDGEGEELRVEREINCRHTHLKLPLVDGGDKFLRVIRQLYDELAMRDDNIQERLHG